MLVVSPDDLPTTRAEAPTRTGAGRTALLVLAYVAATAALLYPLTVATIPPLVDYPSHLARLHILATIDDDPGLQAIYRVNWAILPNLAMEIVALPLAKVFGVYEAGRIFIGLTLVLMMGGVAALHRALHGEVGFLPLAAALFMYNLLFFYGFLNFLFSIGLGFLALAAWIAMARHRPWTRALAFIPLTPILFAAHLFGFCVYGLVIVTYELQRFLATGERTVRGAVKFWAPIIAPFVVPGILFLMSPTGGGETVTIYGDLKDKVHALTAPTTYYGDWIDRILFVAVGVVVLRGLFSKTFIFAKGLRLPLLALGVAAVAMPSWLLNTWGSDLRLPLVIALLFIAGVRIRPVDRRIMICITIMLSCLFAVRTESIAQRWRGYDQDFTEYRQKAKLLDQGARVLVAQVREETGMHEWDMAYSHLGSLAILSRAIFTPGHFSDARKQPVVIRPPYQTLDVPHASPISIERLRDGADPAKSKAALGRELPEGLRMLWPFWANWPKNYDYVVVVRDGPLANPVPRHLKKVSAGSFFDIYRVIR